MFVERKDKFSDTNVIKLIITGNVFCLHNSTLLGYNTHFKYHIYVQTETLSSSKGRLIPREARPKASHSGVYNFVPQRAQAG